MLWRPSRMRSVACCCSFGAAVMDSLQMALLPWTRRSTWWVLCVRSCALFSVHVFVFVWKFYNDGFVHIVGENLKPCLRVSDEDFRGGALTLLQSKKNYSSHF